MIFRQISTGSNILLTHGFELLYAGMLRNENAYNNLDSPDCMRNSFPTVKDSFVVYAVFYDRFHWVQNSGCGLYKLFP